MTNLLQCDICGQLIDLTGPHFILQVAQVHTSVEGVAQNFAFHSHPECYTKLQAWAAEQRNPAPDRQRNPTPEPNPGV